MQSRWIHQKQNNTLIIYFSGWAMDGSEIEHLDAGNNDVLALFDYRDFTLPPIPTHYKNYKLLTWSFGVFASMLLYKKLPSISSSIAINGTLAPIDEKEGIPPEIFNKTVETLDENNLLRFLRRVAGGKKKLDRFLETANIRSIESLSEELRHFRDIVAENSLPQNRFDTVIISRNDAIFSASVQTEFWRAYTTRHIEIATPHLPFYHYTSIEEFFKL